MYAFLQALDAEFGLGSVKEDSFEHTGRLLPKNTKTGMMHLGQQMDTIHMSKAQRADPLQPLSSQQLKALRRTNGKLN